MSGIERVARRETDVRSAAAALLRNAWAASESPLHDMVEDKMLYMDILHLTCMRVVQTQVTDTEYALLAAYARAKNTTIKEAVREAIRVVATRDAVDPDDPFFRAFPVTRKKGRHRDASENHDRYLYGDRA